jgi:hypothetical protein
MVFFGPRFDSVGIDYVEPVHLRAAPLDAVPGVKRRRRRAAPLADPRSDVAAHARTLTGTDVGAPGDPLTVRNENNPALSLSIAVRRLFGQ